MKGPLDTSLAYKYFMSYRLLDGQRYDETVVPYKQTRIYRRQLKQLMKSQQKLRIIFSVITTAIAALMFLPQFSAIAGTLLMLFFIAGLALPLGLLFHSWKTPTHVGIGPKGVRIYTLHWYGDNVSKPIPWSQIEMATLKRESSFSGQSDWIELRENEDPSKVALRLAIDGIAVGDNRKRFLAALKQHLSINQIDLALQDALNPVKLGSHTEMWLDVLSNSPKRLIESHLGQGNLICNGRYKIIDQLGIGGQAVAYIAEQLAEDQRVIKTVVLKEFVLPAEASLRISKRAFEAIEQEAELLSHVSHPRIVAMLDLFVDDQRAYMVLEHVPGKNLRQVVAERGTIGEIDIIDMALQMCDVLGHLHSLNPPVIHRDFTPENIIIDPVGGLKLIDFNVAQQYEASATRTVVGKHSFIPPEQFRGRACPQSDIYALGSTLYFLLTGTDPEPITVAHPQKPMPMISKKLDTIVAKCTAQDLSERYENTEQIAEDIRALRNKTE